MKDHWSDLEGEAAAKEKRLRRVSCVRESELAMQQQPVSTMNHAPCTMQHPPLNHPPARSQEPVNQ